MKLPKALSIGLAAVQSVLAVDPTAAATPCVPSRTVDAAIQYEITLGCQNAVNITSAVCSDYLAQEILTAQTEFCGNKTEAFAYCESIAPGLCDQFDPTGGNGGTNCTQNVIDIFDFCGSGVGWFDAGDPISLSQCSYYELGLCVPEDGVGHYDGQGFQGMPSDCQIPSYVPACGVYPPSTSTPSSAPSTTANAASTQATANSTPISTPSALPYIGRKNFKLIVNGNFSIFVDHSGSITTDPALAQLFYIDQDELITQHGYRVGAASDGNSTKANVVLAAQFSALPYSTKFSLQSQGTNPMDKRQAVGLTSLVWTNAAFAAPTTAARFCIFNNQVYAILQSGGVGANFDAGCVTATISIYYTSPPLPITTSSSAPNATSCPVGQTLVAYMSVHY